MMHTANATGLVFTFDHEPGQVYASLTIPRKFFDLVDAEEQHCKTSADYPTTPMWFKQLISANVEINFHCFEPPAPVADLWKDDPDEVQKGETLTKHVAVS